MTEDPALFRPEKKIKSVSGFHSEMLCYCIIPHQIWIGIFVIFQIEIFTFDYLPYKP